MFVLGANWGLSPIPNSHLTSMDVPCIRQSVMRTHMSFIRDAVYLCRMTEYALSGVAMLQPIFGALRRQGFVPVERPSVLSGALHSELVADLNPYDLLCMLAAMTQ